MHLALQCLCQNSIHLQEVLRDKFQPVDQNQIAYILGVPCHEFCRLRVIIGMVPREYGCGSGVLGGLIYSIARICVLVCKSCPTLCDPMDCSLSGSSVQGKNAGVGCHFLLQGNFPTQGSDPKSVTSALAGRFSTTEILRKFQDSFEFREHK